jgi:hypothetical protein
MAIILDTGALLAFEQSDPTLIALLDEAHQRETPVRTTSGATAQAWRHRAEQVRLIGLLRGVDEVPIDPASSIRIGTLLARSRTTDVIDASVVDLAGDGDEILTTDPADIIALARAADRRLGITPIST